MKGGSCHLKIYSIVHNNERMIVPLENIFGLLGLHYSTLVHLVNLILQLWVNTRHAYCNWNILDSIRILCISGYVGVTQRDYFFERPNTILLHCAKNIRISYLFTSILVQLVWARHLKLYSIIHNNESMIKTLQNELDHA